MEPIVEFLSQNIAALADYLIDANKRIYWVYLASALALAIPAFLMMPGTKSVAGFFRYVFPKKVYFAKSARHDYGLFIVNRFIKALLFGPIVITMVPIALATTELLEGIFGTFEPFAFSQSTIIAIFTLALFVFDDFTRFLLHYILHKVPFLWEFHKVHHSATVLTPMTIYRSHPVESYLYACRMALTQGIVVGLGYYFFGPTLKMADILGANVFVFLFNFMGSNLRHSHIWLSWGDKVENWFISPAQHQIHHSNNPKHFDTNIGSALAVWDRLFRCHIPASQAKNIEFGVGKHDPGHNSLLNIYWLPFKEAFLTFKKKRNH